MIMKNEKYIAPEMEVVDVKMESVLMQGSYQTNPFHDDCMQVGYCTDVPSCLKVSK